jgi:hypothetical protein
MITCYPAEGAGINYLRRNLPAGLKKQEKLVYSFNKLSK